MTDSKRTDEIGKLGVASSISSTGSVGICNTLFEYKIFCLKLLANCNILPKVPLAVISGLVALSAQPPLADLPNTYLMRMSAL